MTPKQRSLLQWTALATGAAFIVALPWTWLTRQIPLIGGVLPASFFLAVLFVVPAVGYWLLELRGSKSSRLREVWLNPWSYAGCLAIWAVCSIGWSAIPGDSARWTAQFLAVVVVFFLLHLVIAGGLRWVLACYVISSAACAVYGLHVAFQGYGTTGYLRPFFGAMDPNTSSAIFLVGLGAGLFLAWSHSRAMRVVGLVSLPVYVAVLGASGSRSGVLGLIFALVVTSLLALRRQVPRAKSLLSLALCAGTMLAGAIGLVLLRLLVSGAPGAPTPFIEGYSALRLLDVWAAVTSDSTGRFAIWGHYLATWPDWLVHGLGAGVDYQVVSVPGFGPVDTHSVLLQLLVQLGVPGAVLGLCALVLFVREALRGGDRVVALVMFAGLLPLALTAGILSLAAAWLPAALATMPLSPGGREVDKPRPAK